MKYVVLVDDVVFMRCDLEKVLLFNYKNVMVLYFENGCEVVEVYQDLINKKFFVFVIILDYIMFEMSGFEICKKMMMINSEVFIIVFMGLFNLFMMFFEMGIKDCIRKFVNEN